MVARCERCKAPEGAQHPRTFKRLRVTAEDAECPTYVPTAPWWMRLLNRLPL